MRFMATGGRRGFLRNHGLSVVMLGVLFLGFLAGQVATGMHENNEERARRGEAELDVFQYLRSAHFVEATAESFQNWQSEFLAIGSMVVLSIWLRETNSPESKEVQTPYWENEE